MQDIRETKYSPNSDQIRWQHQSQCKWLVPSSTAINPALHSKIKGLRRSKRLQGAPVSLCKDNIVNIRQLLIKETRLTKECHQSVVQLQWRTNTPTWAHFLKNQECYSAMASYTMIQQIILPEETPQLQNPVMTHQELPSPTTLTGGCQIVNAFEKEERIEMENQEKTPTPEMIVCSGENPWKSQGGKLSRNYWQTL